jgi:hypothetical protein
MSEERRCDKCDRLIYQWGAHDGFNCEAWPEMGIGQTSVAYKGFEVVRFNGRWAYSVHGRDEWVYVASPVDAFAEIDSLHDRKA